jgi:hypothetical protein
MPRSVPRSTRAPKTPDSPWTPGGRPFNQGAFSGAGEVLNDIYAGIDVDIAVRNNQAWIYRISYQVTLIGLLAYNPVIQ